MDQTGRKKILIADDEQDLREILKMILSAEGYEVVEAENGLQAARLADESIDMYILDVNMPEETGFEAAKKIRARFQAPLLFLTAYSGEADKVNGFLIGADDYIVKPFSNMEMIMRVRAVFRRAEQGTPPAAAREETAEKKGDDPHRRFASGYRKSVPYKEPGCNQPDLYGIPNPGAYGKAQKKNLLPGQYLPECMGGRRCWGRCNYGTHKEYPKKNGRQFTKSEIYKNSLGKGILH